jgi:hypothetical protein
MPPKLKDAKELVTHREYASRFRKPGADHVETSLAEIVEALRAGADEGER